MADLVTAPDARRRVEEALVFMDAALRDDMPPLPSQVRWLADAVRALLAAGPEAKAEVTAGQLTAILARVACGDSDFADAQALDAELKRRHPGHDRIGELEALLRECNAVCLCGCPDSEHEADECGESCGHDNHECIRVAQAVLEIVQRYRVALSDALRAQTTPPPSDAVREAAEVVRTILTAHDARLSESGVLTYGPPSKGTGFVAAIQWLRRYDAARGGE